MAALIWPVANVSLVQQQRENHFAAEEDRNAGRYIQDGQCESAATSQQRKQRFGI